MKFNSIPEALTNVFLHGIFAVFILNPCQHLFIAVLLNPRLSDRCFRLFVQT